MIVLCLKCGHFYLRNLAHVRLLVVNRESQSSVHADAAEGVSFASTEASSENRSAGFASESCGVCLVHHVLYVYASVARLSVARRG